MLFLDTQDHKLHTDTEQEKGLRDLIRRHRLQSKGNTDANTQGNYTCHYT